MSFVAAIKRRLRNKHIGREETTYRRLLKLGYQPSGIIDVGAYEGNWSRLAREVWGAVPTVMVEAQESKAARLRQVSEQEPNLFLELAVLAASSGQEVTFYEMETGSSLFPEQSDVARTAKVLQARTLDEVAVCAGASNLFLKIDVQGAELEVLKGGNNTLRAASLVQLESAFLPYNKDAPRIGEVISFMQERGFEPLDIAGEVRIQEHLVQIDLLFAPADSSLRPDYFRFSRSS